MIIQDCPRKSVDDPPKKLRLAWHTANGDRVVGSGVERTERTEDTARLMWDLRPKKTSYTYKQNIIVT